MKRRKKIVSKVISTKVTDDAYSRLESIKGKYGFSSVYEIIQSLVKCFLKYADPDIPNQPDLLPDEIEEMFSELSEGEKRVEYEKPKRRIPHKTID